MYVCVGMYVCRFVRKVGGYYDFLVCHTLVLIMMALLSWALEEFALMTLALEMVALLSLALTALTLATRALMTLTPMMLARTTINLIFIWEE